METTNLFAIANDSIENCHEKFGPTGSGRLFEPKDILTNDAVARVVSTTFPGKYRKVASSRPVYYSIFDYFWGATN